MYGMGCSAARAMTKSNFLIFNKCKCFHAKIDSLAAVKSCVTYVQFCDGKCLELYL